MRSVVRTAYGVMLQVCRYLGLSYPVYPNSTLNELLTDSQVVPFQPEVSTIGMEVAAPYDYETDSEFVKVQYIAIGNGGHLNITPTGGVPYTDTKPHMATDAGLFHWIPFVVKPIEEDLPPNVRSKYRLRKTMMIEGVLHVAYYLKELKMTATAPEMRYTTVRDGVATTTPFVPSPLHLKPQPAPIGSTNDGSMVDVAVNISIEFSEQDVTWLREACQLLYGNENYAIVSELAFCSGIDKPIIERYPVNGTQIASPVTDSTTVEAVAVQMAAVISHNYPLLSLSNGLVIKMDMGATEPLYGVVRR